MTEKKQFIVATLMLSLFTLVLLVLSIVFILKGITFRAITAILATVILAMISIFILKKRYEDIKTGAPFEDERSKKVRMYSAGYTFFMSNFIWLGMMLIKDYLSSEQVIGIGVLINLALFGAIYCYLCKKI